MAKSDKNKKVEELADMLKRAKGLVLSDFTGLNVAEMTELRRRCRESQVRYVVVKNTLARFAASRAEMEELIPYLKGPNGLTLSFEDPLVPARVINSFVQESEKLAIKGGVFGGGMLGPEDVRRIALLPGREVLLSQVLMQMNAPISGFANALRSILTKVLYALSQVKDLKASGGETEQAGTAAEGTPSEVDEPADGPDEKTEELKKEE